MVKISRGDHCTEKPKPLPAESGKPIEDPDQDVRIFAFDRSGNVESVQSENC